MGAADSERGCAIVPLRQAVPDRPQIFDTAGDDGIVPASLRYILLKSSTGPFFASDRTEIFRRRHGNDRPLPKARFERKG